MMLDIYAGSSAIKAIQEQGMNASMFGAFLGASGGPKWFCLYELDRFLFGEFFKHRNEELHLVGSSVGAFRSACFAQQDPVAAITRMGEFYSESAFSSKATTHEVTAKALALIEYLLGTNGEAEIINNTVFKTHILTDRVKGLASSENRALQMLGLMKSLGLNRVDRKLIKDQYQRVVFRSKSSTLLIDDYCEFDTHYVELCERNLKQALLASGAIPMVMEGVRDIEGAPKGIYRDGGIIDYHFDIKFNGTNKLTLYPHFNADPKAGWFDKSLKRKVSAANYDNVVMLVPSKAFIDSLPYQKIPDRKDFQTLGDKDRILYWQTVMAKTQALADDFADFCAKPDASLIKPI